MRIVVGVGAGVAAFKAATVVREFMRLGHEVRVVPTPRSLDFVGRMTWEGLTGRAAHTGVTEAGGADHVELARWADLLVVVPATADLLARLRAGLADDLLTTTAIASPAPLVLAPAMHTAMWEHPATVDNVRELRARGALVIEPDDGPLGSGDTGKGRLPDPVAIARAALAHAGAAVAPAPHARPGGGPLTGKRLLITAGGTHEAIDPVRFIGNLSSGRQGLALARAALEAGAEVCLVEANVDGGVRRDFVDTIPPALRERLTEVPVVSAAELETAVMDRLATTDVLVMCAAVADFRPADPSGEKIRKDPSTRDAPVLVLERTPDVLAGACAHPDRPVLVVGFAAHTGTDAEVLEAGRQKARRKGADLLAVNAVGGGRGFGDVPNALVVLDGRGDEVLRTSGTKSEVAGALIGLVSRRAGTIEP